MRCGGGDTRQQPGSYGLTVRLDGVLRQQSKAICVPEWVNLVQ